MVDLITYKINSLSGKLLFGILIFLIIRLVVISKFVFHVIATDKLVNYHKEKTFNTHHPMGDNSVYILKIEIRARVNSRLRKFHA